MLHELKPLMLAYKFRLNYVILTIYFFYHYLMWNFTHMYILNSEINPIKHTTTMTSDKNPFYIKPKSKEGLLDIIYIYIYIYMLNPTKLLCRNIKKNTSQLIYAVNVVKFELYISMSSFPFSFLFSIINDLFSCEDKVYFDFWRAEEP